MIDTRPKRPDNPWRTRLVLMAVATVVYLGSGRWTGEKFLSGGQFPRFAAAFLNGRLYIESAGLTDSRIEELIPTADGSRLYLAYPPLPAILLMPLVGALGAGFVTTQLAGRLVSVLNVALFDACLPRIAAMIGRPAFSPTERVALNLFFAFGTVAWHNAHMGGDWHLAHAVALAGLLAALREFAGPRRPGQIGLWIALVLLTRPTAALCGAFFVMPWLRAGDLAALRRCAVFIGAAVLGLAIYNAARFGNPLDFGYDRMLLTGTGERLMADYGQFHAHFVPRNAFWFFLAPPWPGGDSWLCWTYDPRGMGLFFASPALLYAFVAIARHGRQAILQDALIAIGLAIAPLLAYFSSGFWQFGHRYCLDYLLVLLVLAIWGMGRRLGPFALALIGLSVAVQAWGILLASPAPLPAWLSPTP